MTMTKSSYWTNKYMPIRPSATQFPFPHTILWQKRSTDYLYNTSRHIYYGMGLYWYDGMRTNPCTNSFRMSLVCVTWKLLDIAMPRHPSTTNIQCLANSSLSLEFMKIIYALHAFTISSHTHYLICMHNQNKWKMPPLHTRAERCWCHSMKYTVQHEVLHTSNVLDLLPCMHENK